MPLAGHRLSWAERKALHERLGLLRDHVDEVERDAIDAAMSRLETAAYGACVACQAPIAWERLMSTPQVSSCTRCEALGAVPPSRA